MNHYTFPQRPFQIWNKGDVESSAIESEQLKKIKNKILKYI